MSEPLRPTEISVQYADAHEHVYFWTYDAFLKRLVGQIDQAMESKVSENEHEEENEDEN